MTNYLGLNDKDYQEICMLLKIDQKADYIATKILSNTLKRNRVQKTIKKLPGIFSDKIVLIFAAGPSLIESIEKLQEFIKKNRESIAIVGIDGATQALLEKQIFVDIIITDLDGGLNTLHRAYEQGSILVVHGHGDNIPKIKQISKLLKKNNIIGSTQIKSTSTAINFGGFTDGDRGIFLSASFPNLMIVLVAYDFGKIVGQYSKPEEYRDDVPTHERKQIKFTIAKKLLRKLVEQKPHVRFYSFEKEILSINTIESITLTDLEKEISK